MPRPSATETEAFHSFDGFKYKYRLADGTTRYRVKDGRKVNDLLSVTTIAGIGYNEWYESNKRELAFKAFELSTQNPETPYGELYDELIKWEWRKAERGTALHEAVENYLKGVENITFEERDRQVMWTSFVHWFENRSDLKVLALEQPIWTNPRDGWAGQVDCVAKRISTGEVLIVDWKFGKPKPEYRWQLNAYGNATRKMTEDGELVPIKSRPTGLLVVSTTYDEQDDGAVTKEIPYRFEDQLYKEFLMKLEILRLGLMGWKDQESAAYLAGPTKWNPNK